MIKFVTEPPEIETYQIGALTRGTFFKTLTCENTENVWLVVDNSCLLAPRAYKTVVAVSLVSGILTLFPPDSEVHPVDIKQITLSHYNC